MSEQHWTLPILFLGMTMGGMVGFVVGMTYEMYTARLEWWLRMRRAKQKVAQRLADNPYDDNRKRIVRDVRKLGVKIDD